MAVETEPGVEFKRSAGQVVLSIKFAALPEAIDWLASQVGRVLENGDVVIRIEQFQFVSAGGYSFCVATCTVYG